MRSSHFAESVLGGLLFTTSVWAEGLSDASLPAGVISIPLIRIENQSAYGVECEYRLSIFIHIWTGQKLNIDPTLVQVGTPPQINILKFDTGSPTIGLEDPDSDECLQSNNPCALYGSYDNETSTTATYAGPRYDDLLIDQGTGFLVNDTFRFSGVVVENINFGVKANLFAAFYLGAPDAGIFGKFNYYIIPKSGGEPFLLLTFLRHRHGPKLPRSKLFKL